MRAGDITKGGETVAHCLLRRTPFRRTCFQWNGTVHERSTVDRVYSHGLPPPVGYRSLHFDECSGRLPLQLLPLLPLLHARYHPEQGADLVQLLSLFDRYPSKLEVRSLSVQRAGAAHFLVRIARPEIVPYAWACARRFVGSLAPRLPYMAVR